MAEKMEEVLTVNKNAIDVLVASLMPTSKYLETRFDHLQTQIDSLKEDLRDVKEDIKNLESRMDKRFEQVDKRFEQVDKRFEQVDKRFEQIDKRFEQIDKRFEQVDKRFESMESRFNERFVSIENKLDILIARIDDKIEKGLRESRSMSIRLFTFAMTFSAISVIGMLGKIFRLF